MFYDDDDDDDDLYQSCSWYKISSHCGAMTRANELQCLKEFFSAMISNKNDNDDDDDCLIRIMVVALCCARSLC